MAARTISPTGNDTCLTASKKVQRKPFEYGLTLIEVMITVIILTAGIVGVIQAYMKSLDVLQVSKDYLAQVPLAENKMIEIQQEGLANGGLGQEKQSGKFFGPYADFRWEMDISPSEVAGLNTVSIKCYDIYAPLRDFVLVDYAKSK